jgi:hypothetical protein
MILKCRFGSGTARLMAPVNTIVQSIYRRPFDVIGPYEGPQVWQLAAPALRVDGGSQWLAHVGFFRPGHADSRRTA